MYLRTYAYYFFSDDSRYIDRPIPSARIGKNQVPRDIQSNDLKTAFQIQNYIIQTRERLYYI